MYKPYLVPSYVCICLVTVLYCYMFKECHADCIKQRYQMKAYGDCYRTSNVSMEIYKLNKFLTKVQDNIGVVTYEGCLLKVINVVIK